MTIANIKPLLLLILLTLSVSAAKQPQLKDLIDSIRETETQKRWSEDLYEELNTSLDSASKEKLYFQAIQQECDDRTLNSACYDAVNYLDIQSPRIEKELWRIFYTHHHLHYRYNAAMQLNAYSHISFPPEVFNAYSSTKKSSGNGGVGLSLLRFFLGITTLGLSELAFGSVSTPNNSTTKKKSDIEQALNAHYNYSIEKAITAGFAMHTSSQERQKALLSLIPKREHNRQAIKEDYLAFLAPKLLNRGYSKHFIQKVRLYSPVLDSYQSKSFGFTKESDGSFQKRSNYSPPQWVLSLLNDRIAYAFVQHSDLESFFTLLNNNCSDKSQIKQEFLYQAVQSNDAEIVFEAVEHIKIEDKAFWNYIFTQVWSAPIEEFKYAVADLFLNSGRIEIKEQVIPYLMQDLSPAKLPLVKRVLDDKELISTTSTDTLMDIIRTYKEKLPHYNYGVHILRKEGLLKKISYEEMLEGIVRLAGVSSLNELQENYPQLRVEYIKYAEREKDIQTIQAILHDCGLAADSLKAWHLLSERANFWPSYFQNYTFPKKHRSVKEAHLDSCTLQEVPKLVANIPLLNHLVLNNCSNYPDEESPQIQSLSKITKLTIENYRRDKDLKKQLALFQNAETLVFKKCKITKGVYKSYKKMPKLKSVSFVDCRSRLDLDVLKSEYD